MYLKNRLKHSENSQKDKIILNSSTYRSEIPKYILKLFENPLKHTSKTQFNEEYSLKYP